MLKPHAAGSAIDSKRYRNWLNRFASYRTGVSHSTIENWLDQFAKKDRDLAARILDAVHFFSQDQIVKSFRSALSSLPGWSVNKDEREGRWFFCPLSTSAGESGDTMLHLFRLANNLNQRTYNDMCISPSELVAQKLTADDTVVLLDDFSGTGNQICEAWELYFSELIAGAGSVYVILAAATKKACERIENDTNLSIVPAQRFTDKDNVFSNKCVFFNQNEKDKILTYNKKADNKQPKGFGECGLFVVFSHKCPNNTIPIFHKVNSKWTGLFPALE